jgi:hypothetical protein
MQLPDNLSSKIDFSPDCWLWMGAVQSRGYGSVVIGGKGWLAHRAVYTYLVGDIPDGLTLDHLCLVKRCVNPNHLEPVTAVENKRRQTAAQTHCKRGHWLAGDNLRINGNGHRSCRQCATLSNTRRYLKAVS